MAQNFTLFAQEGADPNPPPTPATKVNPKDALRSPDFWIYVGLMFAALIIGAAVLSFVDRWRKRNRDLQRESAESLTSFRELLEEGDLTHNEYEKIRNKMAGSIKSPNPMKPTPKLLPPETKTGKEETLPPA